MATLPFVLQAFLNLQKCVAKPEIAKLISKFGMITIPLFQLMAFAEVGDDEELIGIDMISDICIRGEK
jgi:hypothetical protein